MQFHRRAWLWLIPAVTALLLLVSNLTANLISTGLADFVTQYRPWLWVMTVAVSALALWLAVRDPRPPQVEAPPPHKPQAAAQRRGVAVGGALDNNTIATGDRNVIGDNNSVTYIRTVYLQAPGRAELEEMAFDQALGRYLVWVGNRYGQLSLRGIERREQQVLSLTLDDVYVALAATLTPERKEPRRRNRLSGSTGSTTAEPVEPERALIDMSQLLAHSPRGGVGVAG